MLPTRSGSLIEMRLVHIFHLRDFKISRDQANEIWHCVDEQTYERPHADA